jgi:hypothetical protein
MFQVEDRVVAAGRAGVTTPDSFQPGIDRLLFSGSLLAVVAVASQTAIHLVNAAFIGSAELDVNSEGNAPTWAHSAVVFSVAFVCALHALLVRQRRRMFVALAAILAFLSLDEMVGVHERIVGKVLDLVGLPITWDSLLWPALYVPLLGGLFVLLLAAARAAPARPGRYVLVGLSLLAIAVVAEVVSAPVSTDSNWAHTIEGALEEGAELGGWIAIATGLTVIALTDLRERWGPGRPSRWG